MAKFKVTGLEELQKQMMKLGANATKAVPLMLEAGAEVLIKAQQQEASQLNISGRSKGALARSIKSTKTKQSRGISYLEIYPQGVDKSHTKKGVRNEEKGFRLEFGRSNMSPRPWMSVANEKSNAAVNDAYQRVWEAHNGSG